MLFAKPSAIVLADESLLLTCKALWPLPIPFIGWTEIILKMRPLLPCFKWGSLTGNSLFILGLIHTHTKSNPEIRQHLLIPCNRLHNIMLIKWFTLNRYRTISEFLVEVYSIQFTGLGEKDNFHFLPCRG